MKEEIIDNVEILNIVIEIKILIIEGRYSNDSIKDFQKDFPEEIIKIGETLFNCIGENDLETLNTEVSDTKWKYLTKKLAYPYEHFVCLKDYQKHVNNSKKEDLFNKLKNDYPSDKERETTKMIIMLFENKNGELTQPHVFLRNL